MTLEENIKICLSLIDEYSSNSILFTEDEDIKNKIKILYNAPYQELSQYKKILKIVDVEKNNDEKNHYTEYLLPEDKYQLKNIIAIDSNTNKVVDGDYYILGDKLYINDNSHLNYKIEYYSYPTIITIDTDNAFKLEIDTDVQNILPYAVANDLLKSDPSSNYISFKNEYDRKLQQLDIRSNMPIITIDGGVDI